MAQRVGRGIALLFHDHGARKVCVVISAPRPYFSPGKSHNLVNCVVLCIVCVDCVVLCIFCVNVYCTTATGCQPNCS